jgi:hypothetical protein
MDKRQGRYKSKATRSLQWKIDKVVQTDCTRPCSRTAPQQGAHEHALAVVDADRLLELLEDTLRGFPVALTFT